MAPSPTAVDTPHRFSPHIPCCKYPGGGGGAALVGYHIAPLIEFHYLPEGLGGGPPSYGHKDPVHGKLFYLSGVHPLQQKGLHPCLIALYLLDHGLPYRHHVLLLEEPLLQDLLGPELIPPVDQVDLACHAGEVKGVLHRTVPSAHHGHDLLPEEGTVAHGADRDPLSHVASFPWDLKLGGLGPGGNDQGLGAVRSPCSLHHLRPVL